LLQCPKTGQPLKIYMQRGDIGALPLPDGSVDVLLTMNGYHAFPEKEKALREMARVAKRGGTVPGCSYIKDQRKLTDFVISHIYKQSGSFTPPFYDFAGMKEQWDPYFEFEEYDNVNSIVYFSGRRRNI